MLRILIAAGGTGGHIYPGISAADELQKRGHQVVWSGVKNGMEARLIKGKYPFYAIHSSQFRVASIVSKIKTLVTLSVGTIQALYRLIQLKPDAVLVMGGYVSVPYIIASRIRRTPLMAHEQNSVPGMANKLACRLGAFMYVAYPNVFLNCKKRYEVGNPVSIQAVRRIACTHSPKRILITGGSLGAEPINNCVVQSLGFLKDCRIVHQVGEKHLYRYLNFQKKHPHYKVLGFTKRMQWYYEWADVIVARAGALSVAEMMQVGKPVLFVPYAYAVDNHQFKNAQSSASFRCMVLEQNRLNPYSFHAAVRRLLSCGARVYFGESGNSQKRMVNHMLHTLNRVG